MFRGPPKSIRTDTLCPYTTLFLSVLSMWRFNSENVRVDSPIWSSPLVSTCNVLVMCKISTRDGARRRAAVTSRACVTAIDEEELMLSVNTGRDRCLGHVHADSGAF